MQSREARPITLGRELDPIDANIVTFIEPYSPSHPIAGFDMACAAQRKSAADQAMKSGDLVWNELIRLVQAEFDDFS